MYLIVRVGKLHVVKLLQNIYNLVVIIHRNMIKIYPILNVKLSVRKARFRTVAKALQKR